MREKPKKEEDIWKEERRIKSEKEREKRQGNRMSKEREDERRREQPRAIIPDMFAQ